MFVKQPKARKRIILRLFVIGELTAFVGSYFIWSCMNTNPDFRYYMHENFPSVLNSYYKMGEQLGGLNTKDIDYDNWKKEGKSLP